MDTLEEKETTPIDALNNDALYHVLVGTLPARWRMVAAHVCHRWRQCVSSEPLAARGWRPIELTCIDERRTGTLGCVVRSYPLSLQGALSERSRRRGRRLFFEALTTGNLRVLEWIEADAGGPLWHAQSDDDVEPLIHYDDKSGSGPWAIWSWRGGSLACEAAAGSGQMASLRWLRERPEPCPWDARALYQALAIGRLDIAARIHGSSNDGDGSDSSPCNVWYASVAIQKAIRSGDPAVVEWVCERERASDAEWWHEHFDSFDEHRSDVEALPCAYATEVGHDHLIPVLEAHGYPFRPRYCAEAAARAGRLDALRSILARHPITDNDGDDDGDDGDDMRLGQDERDDPIAAEGLVDEAISGGHVPLIEWVYNTFAGTTKHGGTRQVWDPNIVPYTATSDGNSIPVLDWLRMHPGACHWEPGVLRKAIMNGDMRVARWLREVLDPPCPWVSLHSLNETYQSGVRRDGIADVAATVGWAIDAGCPWDPAAFAISAATYRGDDLGHLLDIVVSRVPSCVDDGGATVLAAVSVDCPQGAHPGLYAGSCPSEWRADRMWRAVGRGFPWHPNVCAVLDAGECHAEALRAIAAGCPCPDPAVLMRIARGVALLLGDYDDGGGDDNEDVDHDDDDDDDGSCTLDDMDADGDDDNGDGSGSENGETNSV